MLSILVAAFKLFDPSSSAQIAEDWDFTRKDYQALTAGGKALGFAEDSDWLPEKFQNNLRATLAFALGQNLDQPSTDGINTRDFYHGHVACKMPTQVAQLRYYESSIEDSVCKAYGVNCNQVNEANFQQYVEVVKIMEINDGDFLKKVLKSGLCEPAIFYHTYETVRPEDGANLNTQDPRRNILTENRDLQPKRWTPPAPNYEFDRENDPEAHPYYQLMQIAFLVDHEGKIHVTRGTTTDLSRVTGKFER